MTPFPISEPSDAALVNRLLTGDRAALGEIYDRYAARLYAFCHSMLRRDADAQDALQDVFVIVATRIATLREADRLRSWLFTVARNECLGRLSHSRREVSVAEIPDRPGAADDDPARRALDAELASILRAAIDGLPERDRMLLELADRQGLPTDEVASVMQLEPGSAYKALVRARTTARRSIGALLVARTNRSSCTELAEILVGWNGDLTPLLRKRIARHIEECARCEETERRVADPRALLGALPFPALPPIREHILHAAHSAMSGPAGHAPAGHSTAAQTAGHPGSPGASARLGPPPNGPIGYADRPGPPPGAGRVTRNLLIAGVLVLLLIAGATIVLLIGSVPGDTVAGSSGLNSAAATRTAAPSNAATPAPSNAATSAHVSQPAPRIVTLTVACVLQPAGKVYVPELSWKVADATGIALSVNDPAHPGAAGHFGKSGTLALTGASCRPADGPQSATVRTVGGTGPAVTQTIVWNLPATASPSPSASATAAFF